MVATRRQVLLQTKLGKGFLQRSFPFSSSSCRLERTLLHPISYRSSPNEDGAYSLHLLCRIDTTVSLLSHHCLPSLIGAKMPSGGLTHHCLPSLIGANYAIWWPFALPHSLFSGWRGTTAPNSYLQPFRLIMSLHFQNVDQGFLQKKLFLTLFVFVASFPRFSAASTCAFFEPLFYLFPLNFW